MMSEDETLCCGTSWFSYIGDPDDPEFSWNPSPDKFNIGNIPRPFQGPGQYEDIGLGVHQAIEMVRAGASDGRQLDWGAWGFKMTGHQVRKLVVGVWPFGMKATLHDELANLEGDRAYIVVVGERW
ncbi:hypothetical protein [Rhodopseudomonas palustris]|uniref:hypothetical protein n=1 Tax=Rhodopseudomonas palustris TaxID=1076 RepID=UPI0021F2C7B0|nr:hypothetical protein [Rhodopseudomonas palustris]UYO54588.1 hypothetical protein KQX61_03970 [Rhodopseudomonas palustris]